MHQVGEGGSNEGGLTGCGGPAIEKHFDSGSGKRGEDFPRCFKGREFLNLQIAADDASDGGDLLELSEGVGAGENVFGAVVTVFGQGFDGHASDIALVDGRCGDGEVWPTDRKACANLRRPPEKRVSSKHAGAKESPFCGGRLDGAFDLLGDGAKRIGLLEKGMRGLDGGGEENHAPNAASDALQSGGDGCRGSRPDEETSVNARKSGIESLGNREIGANLLDLRSKACRFRFSGKHADGAPLFQKLSDDLPTNGSRAADDQNTMHATSFRFEARFSRDVETAGAACIFPDARSDGLGWRRTSGSMIDARCARQAEAEAVSFTYFLFLFVSFGSRLLRV